MLNLDDFEYVQFEIGNPGFFGRRKVLIKADRTARLEFVKGDDVQVYSSELSPGDFDAFMAVLRTSEPCHLISRRDNSKPDDERVAVNIVAGGVDCEVDFWVNEQWSDPRKRELVLAFNQVAKMVSGGVIRY